VKGVFQVEGNWLWMEQKVVQWVKTVDVGMV
jgi:hypothetical protein